MIPALPPTVTAVPEPLVLPGNATHQGKRAEQQDSFSFTRFDDAALIAHGGVMAVLADGMGGFSGGAAASRGAVSAMCAGYQAKAAWEPIPEALKRALGRANRAVCDVAAELAAEGHCGTTLVAAVVHERRLYWISIGDSRLYLLRAGQLHRLTDEHTLAEQLERDIQAGRISPNERQLEAQPQALVSWLGLRDLPEICVSEDALPLAVGDRLLLCSDGLYNGLSEPEIAALLAQGDPQDAAEDLVAAVLSRDLPQQDNVTVIVLGIGR